MLCSLWGVWGGVVCVCVCGGGGGGGGGGALVGGGGAPFLIRPWDWGTHKTT